MKKSKKTYVLLLVVFIIWGILGFKIVSALHPDNEVASVSPLEKKVTVQEIKKRDTFLIAANYRDPFLGTPPKLKTAQKKRVKVSKKLQLPKKNIFYSGSVAENGSRDRIYFVTIDGQQYLMSKNEKIEEVTLVWGNSESIRVKYPGHTETISLKQ